MRRDMLSRGNGGGQHLTNAALVFCRRSGLRSDANAGSGHDVGGLEGSSSRDPRATLVAAQRSIVGLEEKLATIGTNYASLLFLT